ncbi:sugar phosphate isomerase/epimerase [Aerococcaceae bacterium zg-ZUI334]|uniref:sugar phosphate isomerase/epimerase family protein n=1 Tax=Aerococcaceae TaxID=186827 RepID=UPI0013B5F250|nr:MULTISPECIES: sugar phosphate isomerase/epimerase [unclassified Facklamia]MBR7928034.1 sugar phosphate isomerase/epimerase [Aerococcaceae bacterium zg-ZUI334]NEW65084.1 TIM barrel protein [Facklamia sp. 252]NEW68688.1 TIM barrel protein [Facklamia sp. 253]QQD65481.1 sugar phosphate isomerase/epimerase [Aerococcaceae bacterium zg-252]
MFPLNLGIRAHDMRDGEFETVVKMMRGYGLKHAQLAPFKQFGTELKNHNSLSPGFANHIRHQLERNEVDISVLGCYINIVHLDDEIKEEELSKYFTALRLAKNFGATLVGTETGSVGNGYTLENYKEESFERMLASVKRMVNEAEKWGITVGIEPGVNHPLHNIEKTEKLLKSIPSQHLQLILDPVNLLTTKTHQNQVLITNEAIEKLGNRVAVFHLKDYVIEDDKVKFVPLGQGIMDIKPILAYAKYQRPLIQISMEETKEVNLVESLKYIQSEYEKV